MSLEAQHKIMTDPNATIKERNRAAGQRTRNVELLNAQKLVGGLTAMTGGLALLYTIRKMQEQAKNAPYTKESVFSLGNVPAITTLSLGLPSVFVLHKMLKRKIDNAIPTYAENEDELRRLQGEFQRLISGGETKELAKTSQVLDKLEKDYFEKESLEKSANWLRSILYGTALASVPISFYLTDNYLRETASTEAQRRQQREAIKRFRMAHQPQVTVMSITNPEEAKDLDKLDSKSRNVVPVKVRRIEEDEDDPFKKLGFNVKKNSKNRATTAQPR